MILGDQVQGFLLITLSNYVKSIPKRKISKEITLFSRARTGSNAIDFYGRKTLLQTIVEGILVNAGFRFTEEKHITFYLLYLAQR